MGVVVSTETTITTHTTTAREGTIRDSNVVFSRTADPLKSTPWGFAMLGCSLVTISLVMLNFGACRGGRPERAAAPDTKNYENLLTCKCTGFQRCGR